MFSSITINSTDLNSKLFEISIKFFEVTASDLRITPEAYAYTELHLLSKYICVEPFSISLPSKYFLRGIFKSALTKFVKLKIKKTIIVNFIFFILVKYYLMGRMQLWEAR